MNVKQVIILRKDLKMRKGKMVAQGAHASMAVILNLGNMTTEWSDIEPDKKLSIDYTIPLYRSDFGIHTGLNHQPVIDWINGLFTKICVSCDSEDELLKLYEVAKLSNLPCSLIKDAGLTEFGGVPTYTAVAIGPANSEDIDKITGELKLL